MDHASHASAGRGWRLALPLSAIVAIVAIASSLLYAAQNFERARQEQRLIADTLWAEQALSFEASRMEEGLRALGRPALRMGPSAGEDLQRRVAALVHRSPAILSFRLWPSSLADEPVSPATSGDSTEEVLRSRAASLQAPATLAARSTINGEPLMDLAVPLDGQRGQVAVVTVSLVKLLEHTIPWWLAHNTQISLEDTDQKVLALRDRNVRGRDVYVHRIATTFFDRTFYLRANSSQGEPILIPNVLALAIACLSALLAWTVYALWRDLGRRIHAEQALRSQHALRDAMERSLVTGLRARDMSGRITHANRAFCDMLGAAPETVIGSIGPNSPSLGTGEEISLLKLDHQAGRDPGDTLGEAQFTRPDGTTIEMLVHEAPLLDGSGMQIGWIASVQDITEQKRNAELLRMQSERLERMTRAMTMGEMASALAHELNQPLSAATSYITAGLNITDHGGCDQTATGYFTKARNQTQRAGEIIKRVRQFVGHSTPNLGAVDVFVVLKELVPLIKLQTVDLEATIAVEYGRGLPPVLADRILLEQIILNLTKNAIEAVSSLAPQRRRVEIFGALTPESPAGVVLGVRDRGPGLGPDGLRALTTAFSTTKPDGLGMGVAVCRKAAELLGSSLEYVPRPDGGAEFRLELKAT